jgi:hypothetical protein
MAYYSDTEWRRIGGRRMEFSLPLPSFVECLLESLPAQHAPYVAAGEDLILPASAPGRNHRPPGARNTPRLWCAPLEQLDSALDETPSNASYARSRVFVGSLQLTPELLAPPEGRILPWLVMAGLPGVEMSRPQEHEPWQVGGFFAVERILHLPTSKVHSPTEYAEVQRAMRNALRRACNARQRASLHP